MLKVALFFKKLTNTPYFSFFFLVEHPILVSLINGFNFKT